MSGYEITNNDDIKIKYNMDTKYLGIYQNTKVDNETNMFNN